MDTETIDTESTRDKVARLTAEGKTPRDIAPLCNPPIGVSVNRVYTLLREMGLKPAPSKLLGGRPT